jgi:hypothetical protein
VIPVGARNHRTVRALTRHAAPGIARADTLRERLMDDPALFPGFSRTTFE